MSLSTVVHYCTQNTLHSVCDCNFCTPITRINVKNKSQSVVNDVNKRPFCYNVYTYESVGEYGCGCICLSVCL